MPSTKLLCSVKNNTKGHGQAFHALMNVTVAAAALVGSMMGTNIQKKRKLAQAVNARRLN